MWGVFMNCQNICWCKKCFSPPLCLLSPLKSNFIGAAGEQRNWRLAEMEMKQWMEGVVFLRLRMDQRTEAEEGAHVHVHCTHARTIRPVYREELAGNTKFLLNVGRRVKSEEILTRPIVGLSTKGAKSLLLNMWLFTTWSELSGNFI